MSNIILDFLPNGWSNWAEQVGENHQQIHKHFDQKKTLATDTDQVGGLNVGQIYRTKLDTFWYARSAC